MGIGTWIWYFPLIPPYKPQTIQKIKKKILRSLKKEMMGRYG